VGLLQSGPQGLLQPAITGLSVFICFFIGTVECSACFPLSCI